MPNNQPNQNSNQSGQKKQPGLDQDKVGNNIRKDEPTASGQRSGGGM